MKSRKQREAARPLRLPPVGTAGRRHAGEEYSAGGAVTREGKVLLVKVESLRGEEIWTFPKGHLDCGETPQAAALREVREETGFSCEVLGPLTVVRYMFQREGRLVRKRVRWYWMRPLERVGKPDDKEVLDLGWFSPDEARRTLRYPGDKRLLTLIEARMLLYREGGES